MKKLVIGILSVMAILMLVGCRQVKEQIDKVMEQPEYEKIENTRELLDKILEYIADGDPELTFEAGELMDAEVNVPRFETVPISEIKHFKDKDIVDGFVVQPVVEGENPYLLIIAESVDKDAGLNLKQAMGKVKSDQLTMFADAGIFTKNLISQNETIRQGNFLIYVTWESAKDIVKVFERHVK